MPCRVIACASSVGNQAWEPGSFLGSQWVLWSHHDLALGQVSFGALSWKINTEQISLCPFGLSLQLRVSGTRFHLIHPLVTINVILSFCCFCPLQTMQYTLNEIEVHSTNEIKFALWFNDENFIRIAGVDYMKCGLNTFLKTCSHFKVDLVCLCCVNSKCRHYQSVWRHSFFEDSNLSM